MATTATKAATTPATKSTASFLAPPLPSVRAAAPFRCPDAAASAPNENDVEAGPPPVVPTEAVEETVDPGKRFWTPRMRSYILEWILTVIVLVVPLALAFFLIPFRTRAISLLDASIQQPYYPSDTLNIVPTILISALVPLFVFVLYPFLFSHYASALGLPPHPYSAHYSFWWGSCLVQSIGITVVLSEIMKRLIQEPRPDFLARCFPNGIPAEVQTRALTRNYIVFTNECRPDSQSNFEDGLQSMPSEHTSLAWSMTVVLVLFFYTLRRELVSHAERRNREKRCEQRDALVARLVANGVAPPRARLLVRQQCAPMASPSPTPSRSSWGRRDKSPLPVRSPDLRPPSILFSAFAAPTRNDCVTEGCGRDGDGGGSTGAPRNQGDRFCYPDPNVAAADVVDAEEDPPVGPSVRPPPPSPADGVSFWPASHVVYVFHILIPVTWATAVALSRTFDHRHTFANVLVGFGLGISVALAVYRMHLVKFRTYHLRWNRQREEKKMDLEAALHSHVTRPMLHAYSSNSAAGFSAPESQQQQSRLLDTTGNAAGDGAGSGDPTALHRSSPLASPVAIRFSNVLFEDRAGEEPAAAAGAAASDADAEALHKGCLASSEYGNPCARWELNHMPPSPVPSPALVPTDTGNLTRSASNASALPRASPLPQSHSMPAVSSPAVIGRHASSASSTSSTSSSSSAEPHQQPLEQQLQQQAASSLQ